MLVKYPKIHRLGTSETEGILDEVVVCESKVDGANFRCRYVDGKLIFGSRNHELSPDTDPNNWPAIRAYKKALEEYEDNFIPNVVYFSESMQRHTLKYENIPDTIGYDVYDLEREEFYDWRAAKRAFEDIGIPFIHVHFEKHGSQVTVEELKRIIREDSPYRKEGDEGVVLKCYTKKNAFGRPLFAKVVDELFKEANKKVFGVKTPQVYIVEEWIVDQYLTDARFMKAINYFRDESETIDMSLMPKLYSYINDDILTENILEIKKFGKVNFKTLERMVAKKCAAKLKEYIYGSA